MHSFFFYSFYIAYDFSYNFICLSSFNIRSNTTFTYLKIEKKWYLPFLEFNRTRTKMFASSQIYSQLE